MDTRISWVEYFSELARLVSKRSPCHRLHVGCVIVKDKHIVSTGYNGFLPGAEHKSIVLDGHEQATVHAEQNCIADCARRGVSMDGADVYITHYPCINCFKGLVASGVKGIYYLEDYRNSPVVEELATNSSVVLKNIK
jgi:dCMP deaminase